MNCKSTYSTQKHSKWAVIFALFLSLFTFSNSISISIISRSNPVYQTEWVYQKRKHFVAPVVLQKARKRAASVKEYFDRILAFNRSLVLKLTKLAETSLSIPTALNLFVQEAALNYPAEIDLAKN